MTRIEGDITEMEGANEQLGVVRRAIVDERDRIEELKAMKGALEETITNIEVSSVQRIKDIQVQDDEMNKKYLEFQDELRSEQEKRQAEHMEAEGNLNMLDQKIARAADQHRGENTSLANITNQIKDTQKQQEAELEELQRQLTEARQEYKDKILEIRVAFQLAKNPPKSEGESDQLAEDGNRRSNRQRRRRRNK